jgi:DNA-binding XRE family transcriptional regulator
MCEMTDEERSDFAAFLKSLRERIPPNTSRLGSWNRLPFRYGRHVTQEEVAEAIGVSRNWYSQLECGTVRASTKLVARLARAIALTSDERTKLFTLAIPEMAQRL